MSILVFLEHHGTELQKGSLGVLAKAATLGGGDVAAVLVGGGVSALAPEAGKFGAAKVYLVDDDSFEPPLPQARVDVLAKVVRDGGYDTVLFANSVLAADAAAGLAARLDAGLNWDLVDVELRDGSGKRLGLLAHERDLLPGHYTFGLTGRDPLGKMLRPGPYSVRLVAWPTGGGPPSVRSVEFRIE